MTTRRRGKAPLQARSKATVDAIVEATGQVFGAKGFRKTTTAHVAERAGVSVGSLYQYFPDKQALIAAFLEKRLEQDLELMQSIAARGVGASPRALLWIATEEMVRVFREERALYASVAEILPLMERTPEVREGLDRAVALAATMLRAHPSLLGDRDPELLATIIFHASRASLFRILEWAPEKLDDPHLVEILAGGNLGFLGLSPEQR